MEQGNQRKLCRKDVRFTKAVLHGHGRDPQMKLEGLKQGAKSSSRPLSAEFSNYQVYFRSLGPRLCKFGFHSTWQVKSIDSFVVGLLSKASFCKPFWRGFLQICLVVKLAFQEERRRREEVEELLRKAKERRLAQLVLQRDHFRFQGGNGQAQERHWCREEEGTCRVQFVFSQTAFYPDDLPSLVGWRPLDVCCCFIACHRAVPGSQQPAEALSRQHGWGTQLTFAESFDRVNT